MIGIFDSGLGGLTAYREVRSLLPQEDIVYFGDTGRVPYGNRSRETLIRYATQDMNFLVSKHIETALIACGTVSSTAIDVLRRRFPSIPIIGVVESAAAAAAKLTKNKRIAVIATAATVGSGAFERALHSLDPELEVISTACPLFVPLVENGFILPDDEVTLLVAERYLSEIRSSGADTLILGCTHYPIITRTIERVLPGVGIVSSSKAAAEELARLYSEKTSPARSGAAGSSEFFVSDEPYGFEQVASIFLDTPLDNRVTRINIEDY